MEPGLVKKEPPNRTGEGGLLLVDGEDARWDDIGAKWDALVGAEHDIDAGETEGTLVDGNRVGAGHPRVDDDGIGWAEDAHGAQFERYRLKDASTFKRASRIAEEVGPMGELPDYTLTVANGTHIESSPSPENANATGTDEVPNVANYQHATVTHVHSRFPCCMSLSGCVLLLVVIFALYMVVSHT